MYTDRVYSTPSTRELLMNLSEEDNAESHNKKPKPEAQPRLKRNASVIDLTGESDDESSQETRKRLDKNSSNNKNLSTPSENIQQVNKLEVECELRCVICTELFVKAVTLRCSHTFCKYCIETWKKTKSECPICKSKIEEMTATLALDNVIEKVVQTSSEEAKRERKKLIEDRRELQALENNSELKGIAERNNPEIERRQVNINVVSVSVIEVSSDSDGTSESSDTDNSDTNMDAMYEERENYQDNIWYPGPPVFYGGYGNCNVCGGPGHYANGCPYILAAPAPAPGPAPGPAPAAAPAPAPAPFNTYMAPVNAYIAPVSANDDSSDSSSSSTENNRGNSSVDSNNTFMDALNEFRDGYGPVWCRGVATVFYGGFGECHICRRQGHGASHCPYR